MQNNENFAGNANGLFPVVLHEGVHVVDSRLIAEALGIDHHNFMETIRKYQKEVEAYFLSVLFQTEVRKRKIGAVVEKFALLSENQALFLGTLSRNTDKVVEFKAKLVLSLARVRQDIYNLELLVEKLSDIFTEQTYTDAGFIDIETAIQGITSLCNQHTREINCLQDERKLHRTVINTLQFKLNQQEAVIQQITARLDKMEHTQQREVKRLNQTIEQLEELKKHFGIDADCFVYVFYSPSTTWYKIGWADYVGKRKKNLLIAQETLTFILAIPTQSRAEAGFLEKAIHKHFSSKCKHGEWFALDEADLLYLHGLRWLHQNQLEANKA